jgi:hypothetical protein
MTPFGDSTQQGRVEYPPRTIQLLSSADAVIEPTARRRYAPDEDSIANPPFVRPQNSTCELSYGQLPGESKNNHCRAIWEEHYESSTVYSRTDVCLVGSRKRSVGICQRSRGRSGHCCGAETGRPGCGCGCGGVKYTNRRGVQHLLYMRRRLADICRSYSRGEHWRRHV